jgi:hypothetical protein
MADITPLEVITFTPWTDPVLDQFAIDPSGHYSRIAWLPILGPTSWLLLGTISQHLADHPAVTWRLADLARDLGLGRPDRPGFVVVRSLRRLEHFWLLRFEATDRALIRTKLPPLSASQLRRSAPHVREAHQLTFPGPHARGA